MEAEGSEKDARAPATPQAKAIDTKISSNPGDGTPSVTAMSAAPCPKKHKNQVPSARST